MRPAGFCEICQRNVYLEDWSCAAGHDPSFVTGWYDSETGQPISPPDAPAPESGPPDPQTAPEPAGELLALFEKRLSHVGLGVARNGSTLAVAGGDAYEALVSVSADSKLITVWEHLSGGTDPGVRDFIRGAAEEGWSVRVALRRPEPNR